MKTMRTDPTSILLAVKDERIAELERLVAKRDHNARFVARVREAMQFWHAKKGGTIATLVAIEEAHVTEYGRPCEPVKST
jgi:hypothetical protein